MITIHPASNIRNIFPKTEETAIQSEQTEFPTKNNHRSMALLNFEQSSTLTEDVETKLNEADTAAKANPTRMTHNEVFSHARKIIDEAI